jgi:hypothetical protein
MTCTVNGFDLGESDNVNVPAGITLLNDGGNITINDDGIINFGTIDNFGTIEINSHGALSNEDGGLLDNFGTINIHCSGVLTGTVNVLAEMVVDACAPVAIPQSISTDEDNAVAFTLNGTNPDADPDFAAISLQFSIISGPSHGNLTGSNATLTYTPDGNFSDTDSFTFVASDGTNNSTEATITIAVIGGK